MMMMIMMMKKKINKLNAPSFNGLVITWEGLKRNDKIKGDGDELDKNPPMLKLVFSSWTLEFQFLGVMRTYLH